MAYREEKTSHHLWSAECADDGSVLIHRASPEREWDDEELEFAKGVVASYWGLFGAHMYNSELLNSDLPKAASKKLEKAAHRLVEAGENPPKVHSWESLEKLAGKDVIEDVRKAVADGIRARQASLNFNIPLAMSYDLVNGFSDIDTADMKSVIAHIKGSKAVDKRLEKVASEVRTVVDEYVSTGSHKIAVDGVAKKYYEDYYGPYGHILVQEIRKRVRADMAKAWLSRQAVDSVAEEYWSNYYGWYGVLLTEDNFKDNR